MPGDNAANWSAQNDANLTLQQQHCVEVLVKHCTYCGAPLAPELYFCWACAAPYQSIDSVVTPAAPRPIGEEELIRRKAPHAATLFWSYFATVVFGAVAAALLFQEDRPDLQLLLQFTALLITTCIFTALFWTSLKVQFKQPGFLHMEAWLALAALVPMLAINYGYSRFLMRAFSVDDPLPLDKLREMGITETGLVLIFCLWPALSEEIGFRGLLQHWLQVAIRPERAVLLAAFLFAVLHFSIASFPYLFALGALLGWAKWKTGSLYPSMVIHFLHNLAVIELF